MSLYDDGIWPAESQPTERTSKDVSGLKDNSGGFESEDDQAEKSFAKLNNGQDSEEDFQERSVRKVNYSFDRDKGKLRARDQEGNRDWERDSADRSRERDREQRQSYFRGKPNMERGRYMRDKEMGRGRGRWNAERGSPASPRGRFRGGDRSNWGNHGGRDHRDRRFRSPQGRRSRSHSPQRKRMRSRSSSRSRSRSRSDSPRNRRNFSRSASRNRGRNVSGSRSKSPPGRQHIPAPGYIQQVHPSASYSSYTEDQFRGPQPPGVDSPVVRTQYAAPYQHTNIPPPGIPPQTQGHPPGPPPGYPAYDNYYQHQPPPSLYPPGVPEYMATQASAPSSMSWSAPEYPPPSSTHVSDMKHNSSAVPAPLPVPVPVPQPSHDSSINVPPPPGTAEDSNKKEAIERELRTQKQNLLTQREDYIRKSKVFERELGLLRGQEQELSAESTRDNERILLENHKLQLEILNKLKAINNVIDMLTGIIGDSKELAQKMVEIEAEKGTKKKATDVRSRSRSSGKARSRSSSSDSSAEETKQVDKPDSTSPEEDFQKYNYIHFDPENHWCRVCNAFPRTAKEYLHHLHSAEHKDQITVRKLVDMPWHKDHPAEEVTQLPGAPTKRTPIKGLQFFISAPAWYCKLCAVWMGDLHCASIHLKSKLHATKYHDYLKENVGWETNWLAEREQACERMAEIKDEKKFDGHQVQKEKKLDPVEQTGKERPSRQDRSEKSEVKVKKRNRSSSASSSGSVDRNQDIETTGGWVKEHKERGRMREKERPRDRDKEQARNRGKDRDSNEHESETDKSKSIRVAMRNKESRHSNEKSFSEPIDQAMAAAAAAAASVQLKSKWDSPDRKNGTSPSRPPPSANRHSNAPVDDRMMREWLPVEESETQLLSNLKDRMKRKHVDNHKEKETESEPKNREKDRSRRDKNFYTEPQYGRNKFTRDVTPPRNRRSRGAANEDTSRWESTAAQSGGAMRESPPPHRRMNEGKGRDRDRERDRGERERERDRDRHGERDRDRERERGRGREDDVRHPPQREEEDDETHFEKQSGEYRKGRKQQPVLTIKSKLPFIGRMPVFKNFSKKPDDKCKSDENSSPPHSGNMSPGPLDSTPGKHMSPAIGTGNMSSTLEGGALKERIKVPIPSAAQINASIMEYQAKLLEGTLSAESPTSTSATPMPKSTLILSKTPPVSIDNLMKNNKDSDMKQALKKLSEQMQFMEKVQSTPAPTSDEAVPMELEEEAETGPGLSKDFQDALQIIFPDNSKPAEGKPDSDVSDLPDVKNPPPNMLSTMPNLSNPPPSMIGNPPSSVPPMGMGVDGMYQSQMNMETTPNMMGSMPPPMGMGMDGSNQSANQTQVPMGLDGNMQAPPMGMAMYDGPPGTYPDMQTQRMYPPGPMMGPMGPMGGPRMGCPPMGGPMGPPPMGMPPMGPMGMPPMGPPPMGVPPMCGPRPPTMQVKTPNKLDADDMAMLGIDADDIGAQGM